MDTAKIDYIMNIFRTLSTEMPEQMLYREDGDNFELKTACRWSCMMDGNWSGARWQKLLKNKQPTPL